MIVVGLADFVDTIAGAVTVVVPLVTRTVVLTVWVEVVRTVDVTIGILKKEEQKAVAEAS